MRLKLIVMIFVSILAGMLILQAGEKSIDKSVNNQPDVLLDTLTQELSRSMNILGEKGTPPPYFMAYRITDEKQAVVSASFGALRGSGKGHSRVLDVEIRVGNHQLDNTHALRGNAGFDGGYEAALPISIEDKPDAIKNSIWLETDRVYKDAVEKMIRIKANKSVSVEEEDQSDDFSREEPRVYIGPMAEIQPDLKLWQKRVKEYSGLFNGYPEIYGAEVSMQATATNKYLVNSEGSRLRHGRTHWRLSITISTRAEDGMSLYKHEFFDSHTEAKLPEENEIKKTIQNMIESLIALRTAPLMEPYTGPAILSGKATAVFFHEIFGHRIEGHRQKDETEGQTFTKQINKEVLPPFISVFDDPTLDQYTSVDLNGFYQFDDEGVNAQRVKLVENGILKNFLMSRSPIKGFSKSNGHGRCQAGKQPVSRQGNLMVESSHAVAADQLKQMLIDECKKQNKPYGLYFEDISGGFTFTRRYMPQAFNVTPIIVYRVYVDGRPDELVRGVDLIGTPLTSFSKIIATGQEPGIFNGYCGAESGTVPVSVIAPAVLTTQIEVQKKRKSSSKPPVLSPPDLEDQKPDSKSETATEGRSK